MKEEISFEDFIKVDIRIGTITEVKEFPKAKKPAYQILIDFGNSFTSVIVPILISTLLKSSNDVSSFTSYLFDDIF